MTDVPGRIPEPAPDPSPGASAGPALGEESLHGRFSLASGVRLRDHAARGMLINAGFDVAISTLNLVRGFILAGFISTTDYGIWGILVVALGTFMWLKQAGIGDKYIQQDEPDQQLAFQKAFTLEAMFSGVFMGLLALAVPIVALVYGRAELLAPGFVMVLILPAGVLQTPLWILYRQMHFARQRMLQAIDPIVGFVVSVSLAVAGAGYWALLLGVFVGVYASALAAVLLSPYRLAFRYEPGTLRSYASFSWPLLVAGGSGLVIAQTSLLFGEKRLGLAAAGAITLSASISQFANRVDAVVTGTMYPAICAVRDRTELLFESFQKSNRLGLIFAVPFGTGLALFADDLVAFGIGEKWEAAVPVLQAFGLMAAANHLGFNWDAYFRARGETKPIAIAAAVAMVAFLASAIPLLYLDGLRGFAIGIGVQAAAHLACRAYFLTQLFDGFQMARHAVRAIAPTIPAAVAVLVVRALDRGERGAGVAVAELALFAVVTAVATIVMERRLLAEALGYMRRGSSPAVA